MSLNVLLESSGFMGLDLVKILLHLLNFAILLVIVGVLIYKPMMKLIRERQETCKKQIEEHESKMKEAADVKAEYEALMRSAAQEISEQKATATQEIETRREEELASAKRQASAMLEQASAEIAAEKIRAVHEMKGEIVSSACMIASGILGKKITEEEDKRIVEDCLKEWEEDDEAH